MKNKRGAILSGEWIKPLTNMIINNGYSTKTVGNYGNQQRFL
jgi:hypothetical protein